MRKPDSISIPVYHIPHLSQRDCRILLAGHYVDIKDHELLKRKVSEWVILLCSSGSGWFCVEGEPRQPLKAGQILILPPDRIHSYGNDPEGWSLLWTHCTGNLLAAVWEQIHMQQTPVLPFSGRSLIPSFEQLLDKLRGARSFADILFAESLLTQMLCILMQNEQPAALPTHQTELVQAAVDFLETTTNYSLSLDELSDYLGISKYHFIRLFRQYTGDTPMEYFQRIRLKQACTLLADDSLSVAQISERLGYSTPYHFSNSFKSAFGISPSKYRQLL